MLLAMITSQSVQTLHAIRIDNIIMSENLVIMPIKTMLKQTTQQYRKFFNKFEEAGWWSCSLCCKNSGMLTW